jgi:hypothetical protein
MERTQHEVDVELARRHIANAISEVVLNPKLTGVTQLELVAILLGEATRMTNYRIEYEAKANGGSHGKATTPRRRRRQAETAEAKTGDHGEAGAGDARSTVAAIERALARTVDKLARRE